MNKHYDLASKFESLFNSLSNSVQENKRKHEQEKFFEVLYRIEIILNEMESVNTGKAQLLKQTISKIEDYRTEITIMAEDLEKPFLISIVGMGKYGKSTLINALAEQNVAEMDILPKTWKIDIFEGKKNAKKTKIAIINSDNTIINVNYKKAKEILLKEENKRIKSEIDVYNKFEKNKDKYKTIHEKEEYKQELQTTMLYSSPIIEVHWPIQTNDLLNNFRIVDTPGLIQNLLGEIRLNINDYYYKADGVIWLIDATKISAKESLNILTELIKDLKELGGSPKNMICALNRIDIVREAGGKEAVTAIISEAKELFKDIFKEIIPISAKEALDGFKNQDILKLNNSGISKLRQQINSKFLNDSQNIQIESKKNGLKKIINEINGVLLEYQQKIISDEEKIKSFKRKISGETDQFLSVVSKRLGKLIAKHEDYINDNIDNKIDEIFTLSNKPKDEQITYIYDEIFNFPKLNKNLKSYTSDTKIRLENLTKHLQTDLNISRYKYITLEESMNYEINFTDYNYTAINKTNFVLLDNQSTSAVGAVAGATTGALIASVIPVIGTVVGGVIGGIVGALGGSSISSSVNTETKAKGKIELLKIFDDNASNIKSEYLKKFENEIENIKINLRKRQETSYKDVHGFAHNSTIMKLELPSKNTEKDFIVKTIFEKHKQTKARKSVGI